MGGAGVETVTILMTDLVGSTQLESRVGAVAAEDLREEHFGLLHEATGETGGRVVKNTGDGVMVAFESAAAAVSCAILIQQRFARRNVKGVEPLLIKAGVSAGDASTAEGDVFGMPVIEAARLCERCSGGQILAKELVAHLAAGRGHPFVAVGALELKGLPEPMAAVEVKWAPASAPGIALPERLRELPATAYVGRVPERERLTELWGQVCDGSLRVALIAGEAGVGKTRLSTHLALELHAEGTTVLYGRCDEDLGVPYQPWVQALGHLVKEAPQRLLEAHVERFGGDLARLIPVLGSRVPHLPSPRASDPEAERYLLYAAVAGLLEEARTEEPLLLIFDDLHWADAPTLSLLRHVVTAGSSIAAMIVGTYRDSDLSRDHPLTALLADLHREQGVERVKLTGLGCRDVEMLMEAGAGHELDQDGSALAAAITRETAGNPFFAGELLRHLMESEAIVREGGGQWHVVGEVADLGLPQSVREVIGRRVDRLGSEARTALGAAAVIGRDFDLELLLAVVDLDQARLLDLLEQAVAASLLQESSDLAGRFTFTHALVEHALYEDLGATRRALLHKQIAEALEEQCGDSGERLGELASHWAAAVVSVDTGKAIDYARRAADRALEQLAPDEAVRWYRQALELHGRALGRDGYERCELLIGLGEAQRQVGNPAYRETLLEAAELAREHGDTDALCHAVLANSRGMFSQTLVIDSERVQGLEAAAELLPLDDARRARVLALLACELHYAGDPVRCQALATEAVDMARAAGDLGVLAHTLTNAFQAIWVPDKLDERRGLADEVIELAQRVDDPRLAFFAAAIGMTVGTESADRSRVESCLAAMRATAVSVPEPSITCAWLMCEAGWACGNGELDAAEQWANEAFEAGTASGQPDAIATFGVLLFQVRYFQGRLAELVEQSVRVAAKPDSHAVYRAAAALALIESGQADEARELVLSEDFQSAPWDWFWSWTTFLWANACSRLGLRDRAGELYELLAPYSGQLAAGGPVVCGSIAWALGSLATTLECYDEAERHFRAAAEIEQRFGAALFLARTRTGWARALIGRGRPQDLDRATHMLEQADYTAGGLGGDLIAAEVAENRAALEALATQPFGLAEG